MDFQGSDSNLAETKNKYMTWLFLTKLKIQILGLIKRLTNNFKSICKKNCEDLDT